MKLVSLYATIKMMHGTINITNSYSLFSVHTCCSQAVQMRLFSSVSHISIDSVRYQLWASVRCWYLYQYGVGGSQLCLEVGCWQMCMLFEQGANLSMLERNVVVLGTAVNKQH